MKLAAKLPLTVLQFIPVPTAIRRLWPLGYAALTRANNWRCPSDLSPL